MNSPAITALRQKLSPVVSLNKPRLETLCLLIVAMISARTVTIKQNWIAASLNTGGRPLCPTFGGLCRPSRTDIKVSDYVALPEIADIKVYPLDEADAAANRDAFLAGRAALLKVGNIE